MTICATSNTFQHVNNLVDNLILNTLEVNLKAYLDHAFLNIGAFTNIDIDQENILNSSVSTLTLADDQDFESGRVWNGLRKDWVYETYIDYNSNSPIAINSININGQQITTGFNIDYVNGRVILDSAISTDSVVKASHTYRNVQVNRASDVPWWRLLQFNSLDTESITNTGVDWSIGPYHRIQMPSIVIDSVPRSRNLPHELGSNSLRIEQDVIFNVLSENKNDRNQLLDILRLQHDSKINLYDLNKSAQAGVLPLDYRGFVNPNGQIYTDILANYYWAGVYFKNTTLSEVQSINIGLYEGLVRSTVEIIFHGFDT